MRVLKNLYNWMLEKAAGPYALPALCAISFIESSVFPLPPDIMLVPMCLAARKRAFTFALACTLASVAGAVLGYAIGSLLYETVGRFILNLYGGADTWFAEFEKGFRANGFLLVLMAGFTPFPFKVITIMSGLARLNIPLFLVACVISRGGRFFIEAALLYAFGERIHGFIDKYFGLITIAFFVLLVGGFALVKFLF